MKTFEQKVIEVLLAQSFVQTKIAKDPRNNYLVKLGDVNLQGNKFPLMTVEVNEGAENTLLPHQEVTLHICVYIGDSTTEPGTFLITIRDEIKGVFSKQASDFTELLEELRILQIAVLSADLDYDERVKKHYVEVIFEVKKSLNESFAPSDAGDQSWI